VAPDQFFRVACPSLKIENVITVTNMDKITLHSYYFAEKTGCLFGRLPISSTTVRIPGPFLTFDKSTRMLKTGECTVEIGMESFRHSSFTVHLPSGYEEKSKNPNLLEYTRTKLNSLQF
jgi:hypothetical protein